MGGLTRISNHFFTQKKLKSTMAQSPNLDKGGRKEVVTPAPRAEIEVIEIDSD